MEEFLSKLASREPVPGGGGASALIGSISCALCSMVANLTTGKKRYAQYQDRIDEILREMEEKRQQLIKDIQKDADAFLPLSRAYSLDKNSEGYEEIMEQALLQAAQAPMDILRDISALVPMIEELSVIGSRLAVSDVAVAAAACTAGLQGAVMNVYINTKSMQDREQADTINREAAVLVKEGVSRCKTVYDGILKVMTGENL